MKIINLKPLNINTTEINSASSLLNLGERIFTCCDDQYSLYELVGGNWIQHCWSEAPKLPIEHEERKKLKPDFEALLLNHKTILMIPSGSKSNRTKVLQFNLVSNTFTALDLTDFFLRLGKVVPLINLEGAAHVGDQFLFLNRGVQSNPSSLISVNSKNFAINSVTQIDFGKIEDVHLHGSELCVFEDQLYALAVAENCDNSYDDGEIVGSALCKISLNNFKIEEQWLFDKKIKTEGLCRFQDEWLVATDPDGVGHSEFFTFVTEI